MNKAPRMPVGTDKANLTGEYKPTEKSAQDRKIEPFMSMDGRRNLTAVYRAIFDFHKRHSPPVLDDPTEDFDYWVDVGKDVIKTSQEFDSDPFITDLLVAVTRDLEREYKAEKAKQTHEKGEQDREEDNP